MHRFSEADKCLYLGSDIGWPGKIHAHDRKQKQKQKTKKKKTKKKTNSKEEASTDIEPSHMTGFATFVTTVSDEA